MVNVRLRTTEKQQQEREQDIKQLIRELLNDSDFIRIPAAVKFANRALHSHGNGLKENCLHLIGNLIAWNGEEHQVKKDKLRKFAFKSVVAYDRFRSEEED